MNYIVASSKNWNNDVLINELKSLVGGKWELLEKKEELTIEYVKGIDPAFIFFPHWSFIIPEEIHHSFNCVIFHMTDLPFGRGGSPLQNLISRGFKDTKISALRAAKEIDSGEIYLKKDLSLYGTAEEIYMRAGKIIMSMIKEIIENNIRPKPQVGESINFKRRTPEMSNCNSLETLEEFYEQIRMLDAKGYPNAFFENEFFRFELTRASFKSNNSILADVRITKK